MYTRKIIKTSLDDYNNENVCLIELSKKKINKKEKLKRVKKITKKRNTPNKSNQRNKRI
ncbi:hypothetical protein PSOL_04400 [Candidatus Phytoplasma solani]